LVAIHLGELMKTMSGADAVAFVCPALPLLFRAGSEGQRLFGFAVRLRAEEVFEVGLTGTGSSFSR
jgi:hypothetical protein